MFDEVFITYMTAMAFELYSSSRLHMVYSNGDDEFKGRRLTAEIIKLNHQNITITNQI